MKHLQQKSKTTLDSKSFEMTMLNEDEQQQQQQQQQPSKEQLDTQQQQQARLSLSKDDSDDQMSNSMLENKAETQRSEKVDAVTMQGDTASSEDAQFIVHSSSFNATTMQGGELTVPMMSRRGTTTMPLTALGVYTGASTDEHFMNHSELESSRKEQQQQQHVTTTGESKDTTSSNEDEQRRVKIHDSHTEIHTNSSKHHRSRFIYISN